MAVRAPSESDRRTLRALARRIDPSDAGAHNNLGVLYYRRGLTEDAVRQFQRALELDPKMEVARRNLEIAYTETGYFDRRVTQLRERLRGTPDDVGARWELARAYQALGQIDAAADEYRALVTRDPKNVAALIQLSLAEKSHGRLEAAQEWLERARAQDSDSSVVHHYLGEVFYNRGLNAEALTALTRAIALNPENADAHYQMAFVLGDLGRHEEARAATKRAIQLNPSLGRAQSNLSLEPAADRRDRPSAMTRGEPEPEGALAHYNLGLAFRQQGYYSEALREYRIALDRGEDRRMVLQAVAEVHLIRGDHVEALELYDTLVGEIPDAPKLWNERGVVLHQIGRFDAAMVSYRRATEIQPDYALALNNQAVTLAHVGGTEEAIEALKQGLSVEPALSALGLNLGLLLTQLGRHQAAIEAFRHVLKRDSRSSAGWNGLGLVLTEIGRAVDARNAFARAVEADPKSAAAHYNLSFALSRLGDYDGALREVTRAQTLDPYYVPEKFRLAIDLQYENPTIAAVPELSADMSTTLSAESFTFDPSTLSDLFAELDQVPEPAQVQRPSGDPYGLARDYLHKGLLELAAAEANRALGRGADEGEGNALLAEIFAKRGLHGESLERFQMARRAAPDRMDIRLGELRQLLALDKGAEALADAEELAERNGTDPEILILVARARLAAHNPAAALEALGRARARAPQRADLLKLEGDIARGMGDLTAAQQAYEAAIDVDPRYAQVRYDLGRLYEARNLLPEAENCHRAAVAILPTFQDAILALADLQRRTGRPGQAVDLLVEYLGTDPSSIEATLALGRALLDSQRCEKALQAFGRVLAYDAKHVEALFYSGVAYARDRRYREAVAAWETVVRLDPSGEHAHQARKHARTALDLQHIFRTEAA